MSTRAVLTIATGKPLYLRMAVNLARSFLRWHRDSDIRFYIATDSELPLPSDLKRVHVIRFKPGEYGEGFSSKLQLDKLAPAQQTLFVDSDCLCFGPLEKVFAQFAGRPFSTLGHWISTGEFFGDVERRCAHFQLKAVPSFVGAIYYVEPGPTAREIFEFARGLEKDYDRLGFVRLRSRPNEEPLISTALAKFEMRVVADDGSIKADAMLWNKVTCDVFSGQVSVNHPRLGNIQPVLLHFNDRFTSEPPYTSTVLALSLSARLRLPPALCWLVATVVRTFPHALKTGCKNFFRPVYRRMFGTRAVQSAR